MQSEALMSVKIRRDTRERIGKYRYRSENVDCTLNRVFDELDELRKEKETRSQVATEKTGNLTEETE